MKFTITTKSLHDLTTEALVIFGGEEQPNLLEKNLDKIFGGHIGRLRKSQDFSGEAGKTRLILRDGKLPRVLLVGTGKNSEITLEKIREAASTAVLELKKLPIKTASVLLPKFGKFRPAEMAQAVVEVAILQNYEFPYYKKPEAKKVTLENLELVAPAKAQLKSVQKGAAVGQIIGTVVTEIRDLGNHPANKATPTHLAEHAQTIARSAKNIRVTVLHRADIEKEKMGALLAVAQGSDEEPKFIILEYRHSKKAPTVVLVGKGITFDSGGISIKPAEKMEEMKFDMAGAATVMGIVKIAAELKLPFNITGLLPTTENLPSGKALKPGDIIRSRSGKTIEVVNTDAEGRLILCDALDYAKKYHPDLVIDFATLTGAIVAALGEELIGAFTNHKAYFQRLQAAAEATGEKLWPMPLEKSYEEMIKSDFADLRNIGTTRYGDSIHAANFLKQFVDYPWIHLDIAGVAWTTREKPYRPKGATGTGVRLAVKFLQNFKK